MDQTFVYSFELLYKVFIDEFRGRIMDEVSVVYPLGSGVLYVANAYLSEYMYMYSHN